MNGKIAMWQHRPGTFAQEHWIVLPTIDLSDSFIQIQWSPAHSLLAANNISDVMILNEQPISTSISVQVTAKFILFLSGLFFTKTMSVWMANLKLFRLRTCCYHNIVS